MPRKATPDPEKYCERCGVRLHRKRYNGEMEDMGRFKSRKYCSLHCANLREIRSQSLTSQHRISQKYRKELCEYCGVKQHLHVHHRDEDYLNNTPKNLITLCIKCHLSGVHRHPKRICRFCEQTSRKHAMCQKHFQRWKKYGDPFLTKMQQGSRAFVLIRTSS